MWSQPHHKVEIFFFKLDWGYEDLRYYLRTRQNFLNGFMVMEII